MRKTLRKLLGKEQSRVLIEQFAALLGDHLVVDLVETSGRSLSGVTDWPEAELQEALAAAMPGQVLQAASFSLFPLHIKSDLLGALVVAGDLSSKALDGLQRMRQVLELILVQSLEKRAVAQETLERYREINLLYNIGETIGSCLDPQEIPRLVLAEASRIIRADIGVVLLPISWDSDIIEVGAAFGDSTVVAVAREVSQSVVDQVLETGHPTIVADLPDEKISVSAVLCTPLKTQERVLGVILMARMKGQEIFTAGDEKLLMALSGQAAIAVENARLFADVTRQRDEIAEMKSYMDNIFASIASGVITTDVQDSITTLNRAAEHILRVRAEETIGHPYLNVLPDLGREIVTLVNTVRQENEQLIGYELEPELSQRGHVVLRLHISPLKDNSENTTGIAIVVDDLTEHRHLEQQVQQVRTTFERYVAPRVVEQLLSDPTSVRLGGARHLVTTLFADIRGFTSFSERVEPEIQIEVLNRHLTLAAEAVLEEEGTLDKFQGDSVMALFNVPLAQNDHVLRAVRAALSMQRAIAEMHVHTAPDERLSFGVGITLGHAVVGNIGSDKIHNYTAIGDSVNMAQRLQVHAGPGKILVNALAYEQVQEQVIAQELGPVLLKGHSEPDLTFEVLGLRES